MIAIPLHGSKKEVTIYNNGNQLLVHKFNKYLKF